MPTDMTQEEIDTNLNTAEEVESYDYGDVNGDDYYSVTLHKTAEGMYFRYVHAAGMAAIPTAGSGEWLDDWREY